MTIVPFPRKPLDPSNAPRRSDGTRMTTCEDPIHVFDQPSGRCQCGECLWDDCDDREPAA